MATMEHLLQQMQHQSQQLQQQLIQLMQQQQASPQQMQSKRGRLAELRGLGGPPVFNGEEAKYRERASKLSSFIAFKRSVGFPWLAWATKSAECIKDEYLDLKLGETSDEVKVFSAELQSCSTGPKCGVGYRQLRWRGERPRVVPADERYEPRTAGTKRSVLKQLIRIKPAGRVDEVEQKVRYIQELTKRYEGMSGATLQENR